MRVAVGTLNPVKIEACELAFRTAFPKENITVYGVNVLSDISEQPMSDVEAITGAENRAVKALKILEADFGVGLEGGIQKVNEEYFDSGWVCVINKSKVKGIGSTIRMVVPNKVVEYIKKGHELGEAIDYFFKESNSKQKKGHFGAMTNGILDRKYSFRDAVVSALSKFICEEAFISE